MTRPLVTVRCPARHRLAMVTGTPEAGLWVTVDPWQPNDLQAVWAFLTGAYVDAIHLGEDPDEVWRLFESLSQNLELAEIPRDDAPIDTSGLLADRAVFALGCRCSMWHVTGAEIRQALSPSGRQPDLIATRKPAPLNLFRPEGTAARLAELEALKLALESRIAAGQREALS